ncbi:MAG: helix-turn-helix transcriptional regulator [Campylobacter sp.]|nr:helix-turn-helix transcriptional regulator [Campylobacter sp.]
MLSEEQILEAYKRIGKNIAKARKERKISQLALSLEMGYKSVSLVSFAEICLNGAHFNIAHLFQISIILNVPLIELLDGVQDIIDMSVAE